MRGATGGTGALGDSPGEISIHAPHEGCDMDRISKILDDADFNPRTP